MKVSVPAFVPLIPILFLGACASQPASAPVPKSAPSSASSAKAAQGQTPVNTNGKVTGEKLVAMQKAGYKIVDRDGQTYFCRTEKKTGSQIARDTVCVTEKEAADLRELTQRRMGDIVRQQPPPQGK